MGLGLFGSRISDFLRFSAFGFRVSPATRSPAEGVEEPASGTRPTTASPRPRHAQGLPTCPGSGAGACPGPGHNVSCFAEAVQIRLQGVSLWGGTPIPVQFIQIRPYVVTIFMLAGFVGRSRAPKAAGTVFRRA